MRQINNTAPFEPLDKAFCFTDLKQRQLLTTSSFSTTHLNRAGWWQPNGRTPREEDRNHVPAKIRGQIQHLALERRCGHLHFSFFAISVRRVHFDEKTVVLAVLHLDSDICLSRWQCGAVYIPHNFAVKAPGHVISLEIRWESAFVTPIYLSTSIYLSIYPSIHPSIHLSIYL